MKQNILRIGNSYTIYADKPYSYSPGRCGEDYWTDTIFAFELSKGDVIDIMARCMAVNLSLRPQEKGYEIVILFEGHPIDQNEKDAIFAEATPRGQKIIDDSRAEEKRVAEEKKRQQEQQFEKAERARYESLKKKFEPQI